MSIRIALILFVIIPLSACKQDYVKPTNNLTLDRYPQPLAVQISIASDQLLQAAYRNSPDDIMSAATAAAVAHQSTPVASHGQGLAAYAVSVATTNYIVSAEQAKRQREADRRALELEAFLVDTSDELFEEVDASTYLQKKSWLLSDESRLQLKLEPQLRLSSDHKVLTFYLLVKLIDTSLPKNRALVYLNEFEYQSKPLDVEKPLDDWLESDGYRVRSLFKQGFHSLLATLSLNLSHSTLEAEGAKTIRYENSSGRYYERGYLIREEQNRLWFRTLRGGFKSVFVNG